MPDTKPLPPLLLAALERARAARPAPSTPEPPRRNPTLAQALTRGLRGSAETRRVVDLPTEVPPADLDWTDRLKTPGGTWKLSHTQSAALWTIERNRGLLGSIGVGRGKTLISALVGTVLGVPGERIVLMIPPGLEKTATREFDTYEKHFHITRPQIITYSKLSTAKGAQALEDAAPDVIILDEAHKVRHKTSARTKRLLRYLKAYPNTLVIAMSGTLINASLHDLHHLAINALGSRAPIPRSWSVLKSWSMCVDDQQRDTDYPTARDWQEVAPLHERWRREASPGSPPLVDLRGAARKAAIRVAFHHRLDTCPGVLLTSKTSCDAALYLHKIEGPQCATVDAALSELDRTWELPGGEELVDALGMARARKQLSQGFYYRWAWPEGRPDYEWLHLRSAWHRELRQYLKRSRAGTDSPALVIRALRSKRLNHPALVEAWEAWETVSQRPEPPQETVWISPAFVSHVRGLALKWRRPGLIWYSDVAVADALASRGVEVIRPGEELPQEARTVAVSVASHGTGKNLQAWDLNLVLSPPSSASTWEQLLGRTHRQGQTSDEIDVHVTAHTEALRGALESAVTGARYLEQTTGQRQKLLMATQV